VTRGLGRRQLKYGTNTLVLVLVTLGSWRGQLPRLSPHEALRLTKDQRYSLSDQTRKVLAGLEDEVKLTYFQRQRDMARGQDRLTEYQALSPKLKVEYVDPIQSPAKAQAYDARAPWPVLVVEKGDKRERLSSDGEQDITNALIKVTREGKKTVCLLEGEGERSGEETGDRGFSGAKSSLTKSLYDVKNVFLLREKTVPPTARCSSWRPGEGPPSRDHRRHPRLREERRQGLRHGRAGAQGALPETWWRSSRTGTSRPAATWWWTSRGWASSSASPSSPRWPWTTPGTDHQGLPPPHGLRRGAQRPGREGHGRGHDRPGPREDLGAVLAESDLAMKGPIKFEEGKDRMGPVSLAAVATVRGPAPRPDADPVAGTLPAPEEPKAPEGRVVAVGDADFASNSLLGFQGNQDFFLNAVAWLARTPISSRSGRRSRRTRPSS